MKRVYDIQEKYFKHVNTLKPGIYIVSEIKKGKQIRLVSEKTDDLSEAMSLASFEPYRKDIARELREYLNKRKRDLESPNLREIMLLIDNVIKKGDNKHVRQ